MSIASPSTRSPLRFATGRLFGSRRRSERVAVDRNTSPTDFVLRDFRHVR